MKSESIDWTTVHHELRRTKNGIADNITCEKIKEAVEEVASEADVGVSLTVRNHNTRGRHAENEEAENLQETIQSLHGYMQRKIRGIQRSV